MDLCKCDKGEGSVKKDTKVSGLCNPMQRGITGGDRGGRVEVLSHGCQEECAKEPSLGCVPSGMKTLLAVVIWAYYVLFQHRWKHFIPWHLGFWGTAYSTVYY